jgi:hypothetical protein
LHADYHVAVRVAWVEEARPLLAKILMIGNFYEGVGVVRRGLVDLKPVVQNETDDVISGGILVKNSTNL